MVLTAIFYILFAVSSSSYGKNADQISSISRQRRFVGGQRIFFGETSPLASILYEGKHICSGSIVDNITILTAARCIYDKWHEKMLVLVGGLESNEGGYYYEVTQVAYHPEFSAALNRYGVALLKIHGVINFKSDIKPMPLFQPYETVATDGVGLIHRWCTDYQNGQSPSHSLKIFAVKTKSREDCDEKFKDFKRPFNIHGELCTFPSELLCDGDIGGPLMVDGRQAGVLSEAFICAYPETSMEQSCLEVPYTYTEVAAVYDWIQLMKTALRHSTEPPAVKYALHPKDTIDNRMKQGAKVDPEVGAFMVAITDTAGKLLCVGNIISSKHLLTTVMCASLPLEKLEARVDRIDDEIHSKMKHRIVKSFCPKNIHFDKFSQLVNDVAVLQVEPSFKFSRFVKQVFVSSVRGEIQTEKVAITMGWDVVWDGLVRKEELPGIGLKSIEVTIMAKNVCRGIYSGEGDIADEQICASGTYGVCTGGNAGGAPLIIDGYLAGIYSWGYHECADHRYPSIYTDLSYYHAWINETLSSSKEEINRRIIPQKEIDYNDARNGLR